VILAAVVAVVVLALRGIGAGKSAARVLSRLSRSHT